MYHNTTSVGWINCSTDIRFNSSTDVVGINSAHEFRMYGTGGVKYGSFQHDGTNLNLTAGVTSTTADFVMGGSFTGNIKSEKSISILEAADAIADTANYGQIWVRNDAPNTLMYTDDAGNDFTANNVHEIEYEYSSAVTSTTSIVLQLAQSLHYILMMLIILAETIAIYLLT